MAVLFAGNLGKRPDETWGILDLGGGSVQIAYALPAEASDHMLKVVKVRARVVVTACSDMTAARRRSVFPQGVKRSEAVFVPSVAVIFA